MRTTLTIDPDVAHRLRELRRERDIPFKTLINEALRRGIADLDRPRTGESLFRIEPLDLGRCRLPDLDDVAAALSFAEGDAFR